MFWWIKKRKTSFFLYQIILLLSFITFGLQCFLGALLCICYIIFNFPVTKTSQSRSFFFKELFTLDHLIQSLNTIKHKVEFLPSFCSISMYGYILVFTIKAGRESLIGLTLRLTADRDWEKIKKKRSRVTSRVLEAFHLLLHPALHLSRRTPTQMQEDTVPWQPYGGWFSGFGELERRGEERWRPAGFGLQPHQEKWCQ